MRSREGKGREGESEKVERRREVWREATANESAQSGLSYVPAEVSPVDDGIPRAACVGSSKAGGGAINPVGSMDEEQSHTAADG